jgi:hypothetical protein
MLSARTKLRNRLRQFWQDEEAVVPVEWVALTGIAVIGAVAAFWWATSTSSNSGFQPMTNTIQNQVDGAASIAVSTAH